jgi:hypothetical protein
MSNYPDRMIFEPTEHSPAKTNLSVVAITSANENIAKPSVLLAYRQRNDTTPMTLPYQTGAGGAQTMNNSELQYCQNMARYLDMEVTRTRQDSYLRMLLQEQAAKYRAVAGDNRPLTVD